MKKTYITIQNPENHKVDSSVSAPKWMYFIHFVCIGIQRCHVTVKVLNSYKHIIAIVILMIFLVACSYKTEEDEAIQENTKEITRESNPEKSEISKPIEPANDKSIQFLYQADYWVFYNDTTNATFKTQEEYELMVKSYLTQIEQILHKESWLDNYDEKYKTLYIKLKVSGKAGGSITSPKEYTSDSLITYLTVGEDAFLNDSNPVIHELTHLVSYNSKTGRYALSLSLNDGLCEYVSKQIGGEQVDFLRNVPIHAWLKEYLSKQLSMDIMKESGKEMLNYLATDEMTYKYKPFSKEWIYFYACNSSFADYIIQEQGLEYFLSIHNYMEDEDAKLKQEEQIKSAKSAWIEFLSNYQTEMTFDEIEETLLKQ